MSFECKYYLNGHCVLRDKECKPGDKGCILNKAGARFIDFTVQETEKKDKGEEGNKEKDV